MTSAPQGPLPNPAKGAFVPAIGSPFAPALIQLAGVGVRYRGYRILFAIVLDKYHPEVLLGLFPSVPPEFLPPYYWSFSRVSFILSRANFWNLPNGALRDHKPVGSSPSKEGKNR
jgi:hypothetical protein